MNNRSNDVNVQVEEIVRSVNEEIDKFQQSLKTISPESDGYSSAIKKQMESFNKKIGELRNQSQSLSKKDLEAYLEENPNLSPKERYDYFLNSVSSFKESYPDLQIFDRLDRVFKEETFKKIKKEDSQLNEDEINNLAERLNKVDPKYYDETGEPAIPDDLPPVLNEADVISEDLLSMFPSDLDLSRQDSENSFDSPLVNYQEKEGRKTARKVANANLSEIRSISNQINEVINYSTYERQNISKTSESHPYVHKKLEAISERDDQAGILQKTVNYYEKNKTQMSNSNLANENKLISTHYDKTQELAKSLTIKNTQIELLTDIEKKLTQAKAANDALKRLRKNPSIFRKAYNRLTGKPPEAYDKKIKAIDTKAKGKDLEKQLKSIRDTKKDLQKQIKADEKASVKVAHQLTEARRDMVKAGINHKDIDPAKKVQLLAENVKCELFEKQKAFEYHKNEADKKTGKKATQRAEKMDEMAKNSQILMGKINDINNDPNLHSRQKLEELKKLTKDPAFKNFPLLKDIRKTAGEQRKTLNEVFKKSKAINIKDRDNLKTEIQNVKMHGGDIDAALKNAEKFNQNMLDKLNEQKQFLRTNDQEKNTGRIAKYEKAKNTIDTFKSKIDEMTKEKLPEKREAILKELESLSRDKKLPETTREMLKQMHQDAEEINKQKTKSNMGEIEKINKDISEVKFSKTDSGELCKQLDKIMELHKTAIDTLRAQKGITVSNEEANDPEINKYLLAYKDFSAMQNRVASLGNSTRLNQEKILSDIKKTSNGGNIPASSQEAMKNIYQASKECAKAENKRAVEVARNNNKIKKSEEKATPSIPSMKGGR